LLLQGKVDEAVKVDDAILKASPNDIDGRILRGQILNRQSKFQDAVNQLAPAAKDAPDSAMAHYQLGIAYAGLSNLGQAETEWRTAARLQPDKIEPQRALATLAQQNQNMSLLTEASQALIRIEPNSAEGYLFHARAAFASGDAAGAEADIRKAMAVAPNNPAGPQLLASLRMKQDRPQEAEKLYTQALAANPADAGALTGLVDIALERKDVPAALRTVQAQIAKVPDSSSFYLLLGQVEVRAQDPGKAEAALQKAVDLDKRNVPAYLLLGSIEVSRGAPQQAIDLYKQALAANPQDVRLDVALGGVLENQNWQQAEEYYQKALQLQPDYAIAANNLAYLMLNHGGNPNVALTLAQTARKGLPNVSNSADTLGWAYYNQGVYSAAVDALQQAIKEDPKNPNYYYHLGMAYVKQQNYALAKKQFQAAIEIDPNFPQASDAKKMLAQSQPN
jgi:tetratricopeptide (TPR) repeat protein